MEPGLRGWRTAVSEGTDAMTNDNTPARIAAEARLSHAKGALSEAARAALRADPEAPAMVQAAQKEFSAARAALASTGGAGR
jgi:hypothetical protein